MEVFIGNVLAEDKPGITAIVRITHEDQVDEGRFLIDRPSIFQTTRRYIASSSLPRYILSQPSGVLDGSVLCDRGVVNCTALSSLIGPFRVDRRLLL